MIRVAQGHTTTVYPIAVELRIEEHPRYELVVSSDGISRNSGGARAVLHAETLSYMEAIELINQFGLSLYTPSVLCTVVLPDLHRIPTRWYGVATVEVQTGTGWWADFRIRLNGLVPA